MPLAAVYRYGYTWFIAISNSIGVKNVKIIALHYL